MFKLNGVHLKHNKNTADMPPVRMSIPQRVVLQMSMHICAPAVPCVKVGDEVKVGQLVGEAAVGLCSPVYSSVSGKVKKIEEIVALSGAHIQSIVIESDGEQAVCEDITAPEVSSREQFLDAVKKSGIVGLGGAGFPTYVKLSADVSKIDAIVVNGAECEPYITSDTRTMIDDAQSVAEGIGLLMKYLEVDRVVVGIEKNKKKCISAMKKATASMAGVEIKVLPSVYPQGGEKVLVYHTLGRVIKEGALPLDCGVVVINCTTVAAIARYIRTGMPLVEKCVTVDGSAVAEPKNVIAPIGTPAKDVFEFCGGFTKEPVKVLLGGPMMGIPLSDLGAPITKQTNALIALAEADARVPKPTACIKCGKCAATCPFGLSPCDIAAAMKAGDMAALEKLKVNVCMECGCCAYVCPAKKDIVQSHKIAKTRLRKYQTARKENKQNG